MDVVTRLRRGQGPFWGRLKRLARAFLGLHLPVNSATRPVFSALYALHMGVGRAWLWLLRFFWFEPLFRSQCAAVGRGLEIELLPFIAGKGRIVLGDGVRLSGKSGFMFLNRWIDRPELSIGSHTFLGSGCIISVGSSVRIGEYCLLAGGVHVSDYDGHPTDARLRRTSPAPPESIKPVVIGDDVWIGASAKILKGVTIGDRSIVAAGAIVTKSVPPDVIVAGNPARVVKHLVSPNGRLDVSMLDGTHAQEG
jgi:acetyltransferase-like isoleucine patch superfamily enzyme